jgi:CRP/FNR family transcriptional regulator
MSDNGILDFLKEKTAVTRGVTVPRGAMVCMPGDLCKNLVIVESGNLRVYKPGADGRSVTLYHIGPGESCILTAGCILNNKPFPAIAETLTEVSGIAVPSGQVKQWLHDSETWRDYLFNLLAGRLEGVVELVNAVAFQRLDQRLGAWLLQNTPGEVLEATHQRIADELGSTREVISRLLKEMEREGILTLARGSIRIQDPVGLAALVGQEASGERSGR